MNRLGLRVVVVTALCGMGAVVGCGGGSEPDRPDALGGEVDANVQTPGTDSSSLDVGPATTNPDGGGESNPDVLSMGSPDAEVDPDADQPAMDGGTSASPSASCELPSGWSIIDLYPTAGGNEIVSLWSAAANDVWESRGVMGYLHHFDGAKWTDVLVAPGIRFTAIHGTASDNVWAVGNGGTVARWNGNTWECLARVTDASFTLVLVNDASDVWVAGGATMLRWNGSGWSPPTSLPWAPDCQVTPQRFWASSPVDVWFEMARHCSGNLGTNGEVVRWDGSKWTSMLYVLRGRFGPGWAYTPNYALVATEVGELGSGGRGYQVWDGFDMKWSRGGDAYVSGIWGAAANDLWMATPTEVRHWDGVQFTNHPEVGTSLTGSGSSNVWLYGPGLNRKNWNGSSWQDRSSPAENQPMGGPGFVGVWGNATGNVSGLLSDGDVVRFDGYRFSAIGKPPVPMVDLWPSTANKLYAVDGVSDKVHHFDGLVWTQKSTGVNAPLKSIWGAGPNDIWAVGDSVAVNGLSLKYYSTTVHWNGSGWNKVSVEAAGAGKTAPNDLISVTGSGTNEVWAAGRNLKVLRWDGASWSEPGYTGNRVWLSGPNNVWIGSISGPLVHWNGTSWNPNAGSDFPMAGSGPTDMWSISGNSDLMNFRITHSNGGAFTAVLPELGYTGLKFVGAWADATQAFFVTTEGVALRYQRQ